MLAESRRQLEQWKNDPQSQRNLNLSIPLLMQNKVPDGFEDGDHIKVDLRPESVSKMLKVEMSNCVIVITNRHMSQADYIQPNPRLRQQLCTCVCSVQIPIVSEK